MGFVNQTTAAVAELRSQSTLGEKPAAWLLDALGARPTKSGTKVTEETAARVSTVFACVRIIAEDVARLPLHLYERTPEGRQRAVDHPLHPKITGRANPELPMKVFREVVTGHCALWGSGYAEIELDNADRPIGFWPLLPGVTRAVRRNGKKYVVTRLTNGKEVGLEPGRYMHIPGPAWLNDGLDGNHPVRLAREAIGIAMAAEEYGARLFGNGAMLSGILTSEKKLTAQQRKQVETGWDVAYSGISNSQRTALLEANLKWQPTSIDPDKAQAGETRKFQVEEMARFYRMPLVLLGHTEKATSWGTGIEQFMQGYVTHTLGSWLMRWEEWLAHQLLEPRETTRFYFEHILDDLLKGDIKNRFEAYATAVQNGWMSRNEVRDRENMNRIPGEAGDAYTAQLNMAELGDIVGAALAAMIRGGALPDLSAGGLPAELGPPAARQLPAPEPVRPFHHVAGEGRDEVSIRETAVGEGLELQWTSLAGVPRVLALPSRIRMGDTGAIDPDREGEARDLAAQKSKDLAAARRSLTARRRLRKRFEDVFGQVFSRAVRREATALRRLAKRTDADGGDLTPEAFVGEVAKFYELDALRAGRDPSEHMAWFGREYRKPLDAYADLVQDEVLDERGEDERPDSADPTLFLAGYVTRFLRRHAARSTNQMRRLAEKVPHETFREAVEERLEEWEEKRPGKMAHEEAVHSEGTISRVTYFAVGVVSLEWLAFGENCPLCDQLNGKVVGIQDVFLKKGDTVDPEDGQTKPLKTKRSILHAPLHLGCVPGDTLVLARGGVTYSSERRYDGDLVVIRTASGKELPCTPNHPVLTLGGWVAAGLLNVGDHVVSSRLGERDVPVVGDDEDVPTRIEELAKSLGKSSEVVTVPVPGSTEHFHGDGCDGEVTVVRADRQLLSEDEAAFAEELGEIPLSIGDPNSAALAGAGRLAEGCAGIGAPSLGSLGSSSLGFPLGATHATGTGQAGIAPSADGDIALHEAPPDGRAAYVELLRQGKLGPAGEVFPDEVVDIKLKSFHGHVFNLGTRHGLYVANGVVTHNCDCSVSAV